jgi:hypothetical protein
LGVDAAGGFGEAGCGLAGAEADACAFGATTGVALLRSAVWGLRVDSDAACACTDAGRTATVRRLKATMAITTGFNE